MPTINATFRPAATTALERASMPSTCDCCGREGLKRTIKMVNSDTILWMGVGCAAKGTGVSVREINAVERDVQKEADTIAHKAAEVVRGAEFARWSAHLNVKCPEHAGKIILQLRALGGMAAASVGYER